MERFSPLAILVYIMKDFINPDMVQQINTSIFYYYNIVKHSWLSEQ